MPFSLFSVDLCHVTPIYYGQSEGDEDDPEYYGDSDDRIEGTA